MSARELRRLWAGLGIPPDYARTRGLPVQRDARRLVRVGRASDDGRLVRLVPRAAAAWRRMCAAAANEGITLLPLSGYRSVARQAWLVRSQLRQGRPLADLLRFVAAPGCSEHHTGRAIDIGSPNERQHVALRFGRTREFRWLNRHAARFGFRLSYPRRNAHGIGYEPWHWCWHPPKPHSP